MKNIRKTVQFSAQLFRADKVVKIYNAKRCNGFTVNQLWSSNY